MSGTCLLQDIPGQGREDQSRGLNSRTCVLVGKHLPKPFQIVQWRFIFYIVAGNQRFWGYNLHCSNYCPNFMDNLIGKSKGSAWNKDFCDWKLLSRGISVLSVLCSATEWAFQNWHFYRGHSNGVAFSNHFEVSLEVSFEFGRVLNSVWRDHTHKS